MVRRRRLRKKTTPMKTQMKSQLKSETKSQTKSLIKKEASKGGLHMVARIVRPSRHYRHSDEGRFKGVLATASTGREATLHEGDRKEVPHHAAIRRPEEASERGRVVPLEGHTTRGHAAGRIICRKCPLRAEVGPPRDGDNMARPGGIPTHSAALAVRREGRGAPPS